MRVLWGLSLALGLASIAGGAAADTLGKVRDSGKLVIGHREASRPFSYVNDDGQVVGYSIDLCKRVVTAVKAATGLATVEVEYVPVNAENRMAMLSDGQVDIVCGSTTNTLKRQQQVSFSLLTFVTGAEMLVKKGSGIKGLKDLEGRSVGVVSGTTTEAGLKRALEKQFINTNVVPISDHDKGLAALEANEIDAYASDRVLLVGLALKAKDPSQLTLTDKFYSYEPYALMMRKNDDDFRLLVDRTLASLYRTQAILPIYTAWFGDPKRAGNLLKAMYILEALPE
ncbi:MAG: amino acid ABC transporter substrate-binding protein [Pseudomonadota bacterium]